MKKLITSLTILAAASTTMAQTAPEWTSGQDVTDELEWLDYSGESNSSGAWQTGGGANYAYDFQEWEMYNNAEGAEFYQIFHLPAGRYNFKVQGFYRGDYQTPFWNGTEVINAAFFGESVTVNEETGEVESVTRTQSTPLASIASSARSTGRLFTTTEWTNDVEYTISTGETYYVPNCMEGTRAWFNEGYYDENVLDVIQINDGYFKIGIRKTATLSSDWTIFSNFRATYVSNAGDAVQAEIAEEDFNKALTEADSYEETMINYPALVEFYQDAKGELADKYQGSTTAAEYEEGTAAVKELLSQYKEYYKNAVNLSQMVKLAETTVATYDYAGKADYETAIAKAKEIEHDGEEAGELKITSAADYKTALEALASAHAAYAISKGAAADGTYDMLSAVAYPFFCLPKYNPVWNETTGKWETSDVVLNGDGTLQGWSDVGESGSGDKCTYKTTTRVKIADGLSIGTDAESVYTWYQVNTTGYEPYYNHKLPSAKQWSMPGEEREIAQNLLGLPDGFYSLKGCGITWNNDWSDSKPANLGISIESGGVKVSSAESTTLSGWWGYTIDDWTYYTTGLIQVTDGTARIAFHANGFSAFTGLQLIYYGENPDFTAMAKVKIDEAKANAGNKLILSGDIKAVNNILGQIPEEVKGLDAYQAALAAVDSANAYTSTASDYLAANDPTSLFSTLQGEYSDAKAAALNPAITKSFDIYDGENSTYKDVESMIGDYSAYAHYLSTLSDYQASAYAASIETLASEQLGTLRSEYAEKETLESYESALAKVYNSAILADKDLDKASEANPVDVTVLLKNPSFTENTAGWTGEMTVDTALQSAERYNTNFDIYQTVYGLEGGYYEIRVKAFYRDGGIDEAFKHSWFDEDGGYQGNAELYANERSVPVVSICNADALFTGRSFTEYTFTAENPNGEEGSEMETMRAWVEETSAVDEETGETTYTVTSWKEEFDNDGNRNNVNAHESWIYDAWEIDGENRYFYPNSMRGSTARFSKDGGAYTNKLQVLVEDGGSITLGLRKDTTIDTDWCMFDDFQLYYIGKDVPTNIESAESSEEAKAVQYYTIDGRAISAPQKGINIVKMSDGTVRKIGIQ